MVFLVFLEVIDGYISSINHEINFELLLAPNLPKVTAVVGLWGWTAVSLAVGALIMLYKCSR